MTNTGARRRRRLAATAALLGALLASLAVAAPAFAEAGDSAEIVNVPEDAFAVPTIVGPEAPEEYPFRFDLQPGQTMLQFSEDDAQIVTEGSSSVTTISAAGGHDAAGAIVPATLRVSEGDLVTVVVPHRAGNPAAGGAPFDYPITEVASFIAISFPLVEPRTSKQTEQDATEANPPTNPVGPPAPTCKVPSLRGLSLRAARTRLRADHCAIGQVRLGAGATRGKGKVVKQFHPAGAQLAAGAPIAVKLGPRG
jgi:PASTA domain